MTLAPSLHGRSECACPNKDAYTHFAHESDTMMRSDQKMPMMRDRLRSERHPGCRSIALRLLADHNFRVGKLDSAKTMLLDLRRYMQSLGCHDSFHQGFLENRIVVYAFGFEIDSTILAATMLLEQGKCLGRKGIMQGRAVAGLLWAVVNVPGNPATRSRNRVSNHRAGKHMNYQ